MAAAEGGETPRLDAVAIAPGEPAPAGAARAAGNPGFWPRRSAMAPSSR